MSDFKNSSSSNDIKPSTLQARPEMDDESLWEQEERPETEQQEIDNIPEISEEDLGGETNKEDTREQESRFKEGQILRFVKVRFSGNAKAFPFYIGKRQFQYGQTVVAMSDRGMMVGYINSFPYEKTFDKSLLPIRSIARVATPEDIKQQEDFVIKEKESERTCLELIEKYKLDMVLTHVEYTQFGKKAVFFFTAPTRVDFRDLVKELVGRLRMRIELRQISLRDRAAAIGGIAVCGLQTCCSSFLSAYGNVSIKMAKNQNLALVPSKLNGLCGQIKCCIKYEEEVYTEKRSRLPRENSFIQTKNGDFGKVLQLSILEEQFEMLTDKGIIRNYSGDMYDAKLLAPVGKKFPESFEFVTRETGPMLSTATCTNLLPQYLPQPIAKSADKEDLKTEDDESEDFDMPDDELEAVMAENETELERDLDEDDSASEQDIATEVRHQTAAPPSPPVTQKTEPAKGQEKGQECHDPDRQKQKEKALQRFRKRTKRR